MGEKTETVIKNSSVYCKKCGVFLGMTCDPFAAGTCEGCFPKNHDPATCQILGCKKCVV